MPKETQRGYIISGNNSELTIYNASKEKVSKNLFWLEKLKNKKTLTQADIDSLRRMISNRYALMDKIQEIYTGSANISPEIKSLLNQGSVQMREMERFINKKIRDENRVLHQYQAYHKARNKFLPYTTGLLVVFALLIFFISFYKINKDAARNKKMNEDLGILNKSFQYAEEIAQMGHWRCCTGSDIIEWSENMYHIFGIDPSSGIITEEKLLDFIHPEDQAAVSETFHKVRTGHLPPNITYRIVLKNGTVKHLKTACKLVITNNTPLILGTTRDVTAQVEIYTSLEQKNAELQTAVEELASFNHIASHDLQEPLRKIQMFISRIATEEAEALSPSGLEYFERISVSALRMEQLIDDLLLYSQTNNEDKAFETADLNHLLLDARQELSAEIEEKKAVITSDQLPVLVVIPFQIRQLLMNLLGNALKYSKQDVAPKIHISCATVKAKDEAAIKNATGKFYKITITDNGIGFKQEFAEKIFILFQRLHKKEIFSGTGIGLAICKKIVENHKGFITAQSIIGEGASFHIYLPQQPDSLM
jgi:PAS domain S-box-containing protein